MTSRWMRSIRSRHMLRLTAILLSALALSSAPRLSSAASAEPQPTREEQALLDQYPAYDKIIEVTQTNTQNPIHDFLAAHVGQTIYLDTAILSYAPVPPVITEETKTLLVTDRFENPVMQKCWIDPGDWFGFTDAGPQGFPLPLDDADIAAGCATRLKLAYVYGDSSPGLEIRKGSNLVELVFTGFFEVTKSEPAPGKTLYTLTQKPMDDATSSAFARFKPTPERPERQLWLDQ